MSVFAQVREMLPNLEASELDETIKLCKFFKSQKRAVDRGVLVEEMFYDEIQKILVKNLRTEPIPFHVMKVRNPKLYTKFMDSTEYLNSYFKRALEPDTCTIPRKKKLFRIFCDLIVKEIKKRGYELSFRTMLNLTEEFPSLLDKAYPGYVQSGVLINVVESKKQRHLEDWD